LIEKVQQIAQTAKKLPQGYQLHGRHVFDPFFGSNPSGAPKKTDPNER
jgi:hypothetical protein